MTDPSFTALRIDGGCDALASKFGWDYYEKLRRTTS